MQVQTLRKLETLYALFLIFRQSFFIKGKETEAVIERCSVKKVFLEISQNVQENTCAWVSFFNKVADLFWNENPLDQANQSSLTVLVTVLVTKN